MTTVVIPDGTVRCADCGAVLAGAVGPVAGHICSRLKAPSFIDLWAEIERAMFPTDAFGPDGKPVA